MTTKRNHPQKSLWRTFLALFLAGSSLMAAEGESEDNAMNPPGSDVTITAAEIQFPGLTIDRKTHEVRMDATVCLDSGILEYVVCLEGTFEHESIFVTEVKPEMLHIALLLAGLEPNPMPPGLEQLWWGMATEAEESRVRIDVEWEVNGTVERANITSMIRKNTDDDTGMVYNNAPNLQQDESGEVSDLWIFSGSLLRTQENGKRLYAANYVGVVVGIWANPSAVIQYGKETRNPYRGTNQGMAVNENFVPELDTEVQLVFSKYAPSEDDLLNE